MSIRNLMTQNPKTYQNLFVNRVTQGGTGTGINTIAIEIDSPQVLLYRRLILLHSLKTH